MNEEPKTHIHRVYEYLLDKPAGFEFRVHDLMAAIPGMGSNHASAAAITLENRGAVTCKGRERFLPTEPGQKAGRRNVYVWTNALRGLEFLRPCAYRIRRDRKPGASSRRNRARIEAFPVLSDAMLDLAARMEKAVGYARATHNRTRRPHQLTRAEEVLMLAERAEALEREVTALKNTEWIGQVDRRAAADLEARIAELEIENQKLRSDAFERDFLNLENQTS